MWGIFEVHVWKLYNNKKCHRGGVPSRMLFMGRTVCGGRPMSGGLTMPATLSASIRLLVHWTEVRKMVTSVCAPFANAHSSMPLTTMVPAETAALQAPPSTVHAAGITPSAARALVLQIICNQIEFFITVFNNNNLKAHVKFPTTVVKLV
jgi:hypothetical protein